MKIKKSTLQDLLLALVPEELHALVKDLITKEVTVIKESKKQKLKYPLQIEKDETTVDEKNVETLRILSNAVHCNRVYHSDSDRYKVFAVAKGILYEIIIDDKDVVAREVTPYPLDAGANVSVNKKRLKVTNVTVNGVSRTITHEFA